MQAVWVSEIPPKSATLETPLGSENPKLTGHICSKNMMKSPKTYTLKQPPNSYCLDSLLTLSHLNLTIFIISPFQRVRCFLILFFDISYMNYWARSSQNWGWEGLPSKNVESDHDHIFNAKKYAVWWQISSEM